MRFNYNLNVDFSLWRNGAVKMERENNMREFKMNDDEDTPKFGAGSEYNRDQKEEARRKKFGIIAKKYNPDNQPWILKVGGSGSKKEGKKFRGSREGGVSENAAHFVFTQTKDGTIEAVPLHEWYNFQPIQRYKALTAEEAEEEFSRRRKCVNMWTMKMRMNLKNKDDEEAEMDPEETKAAKSSKAADKKKLQISEMDEWMDSDDMSSSDEDGEEKKKKDDDDSDNEANAKKAKAKAKGKGKQANQKKKKRDVDDEAFEVRIHVCWLEIVKLKFLFFKESDDGDEEGREKDYISDSSER
jgi:transcription initiation factor TFIIF subunit alpha